MYITRVLLAVAVATTGLLGAPVSLAGTPLITREALQFDLPLVECDGFEVWTSGLETDTFKYWYDESGVAVRLQWAIHVTEGQYYNRNDPTKFITQGKNGVGENQTARIDLTNGDVHFSGAPFRLTIPGIGHVVLQAGTGFWDESEGTFVWHGPLVVFAEGETGLALCEALD
jgi:hypothetical protein